MRRKSSALTFAIRIHVWLQTLSIDEYWAWNDLCRDSNRWASSERQKYKWNRFMGADCRFRLYPPGKLCHVRYLLAPFSCSMAATDHKKWLSQVRGNQRCHRPCNCLSWRRCYFRANMKGDVGWIFSASAMHTPLNKNTQLFCCNSRRRNTFNTKDVLSASKHLRVALSWQEPTGIFVGWMFTKWRYCCMHSPAVQLAILLRQQELRKAEARSSGIRGNRSSCRLCNPINLIKALNLWRRCFCFASLKAQTLINKNYLNGGTFIERLQRFNIIFFCVQQCEQLMTHESLHVFLSPSEETALCLCYYL